MNWDDEEQVLEYAKNSRYGIRDASDRLKNDLGFLIKAVKQNYRDFFYVPEELQTNEVLYNTAKKGILSSSRLDLRYLSKIFRDDKEVVLGAVQYDYEQFLLASTRLKEDEDVIRITLKSIPPDSLYFRKDFIKDMNIKNPYLILDVLKDSTSTPISFVDDQFKSDKAFMLYAIKMNPLFYRYADESLKKDRAFLIDAINVNPDLRIIGDDLPLDLRQDPEIIRDANRTITKVKLRGLPLNLVFININKKEILDFKKNLKDALNLIKSSKIPNFSAVLNGVIYIGTEEDLTNNFGGAGTIDKNTGAYYIEKLGLFYILPTRIGMVSTLIHELAHQYHDTLIKNGYQNPAIMQFFKYFAYRECSFPKIGDPLSDLREDWWTVRMASDEFYLKRILPNKTYEYENKNKEKKAIPYSKMIELLNCASEYGARNHKEFVAELCTLISLNKVKPSMQKLADDFIQILKKERI